MDIPHHNGIFGVVFPIVIGSLPLRTEDPLPYSSAEILATNGIYVTYILII